MIELNLLPEELRKKKKQFEMPEIPIIPIAAVFVGIVIMVQLLLFGLVILSNNRLNSLNKKWDTFKPEKRKLDTLKKKISTISKKCKAIDDLSKKKRSWARILNELSDSITPNIWFNEVAYRKGSQKETLNLAGFASGRAGESTAYPMHLTESIKTNEFFAGIFKEVKLTSVKKATYAGKEVMNFEVVCRFKGEEPVKAKTKKKKKKRR